MIRIIEGAPVPYSAGQLRLDLMAEGGHLLPPEPWSDEFLAQFDVYRPQTEARPEVSAHQKAILAEVPSLVAGVWAYRWEIMDKSPAELEADRAAARAEGIAAVMAERARRLSAGFDYDFGDARGVHHFGTSDADMEKWNGEVSPMAQALINTGNPGATIGIETATGPCAVSAMEWQAILIAAGQYRQPIYQASFDLMKLDPIPTDVANHPIWSEG
ncbi:hypothetical protein ACGYK5_17825 [Sulfitobacter sp. 1A16787]|uniref:hypothetical protein n=1 Tax=Sulfitobacter sp. 1A16787 TaxID=3368571 RepID=UPI003745E6B4